MRLISPVLLDFIDGIENGLILNRIVMEYDRSFAHTFNLKNEFMKRGLLKEVRKDGRSKKLEFTDKGRRFVEFIKKAQEMIE